MTQVWHKLRQPTSTHHLNKTSNWTADPDTVRNLNALEHNIYKNVFIDLNISNHMSSQALGGHVSALVAHAVRLLTTTLKNKIPPPTNHPGALDAIVMQAPEEYRRS